MIASDLIQDAFLEIGKNAAEQPLIGAETATAIRYLNNLAYSKAHILTDYTVINSGSDELTTSDTFNMWFVKALAIKLAPQFGQLESYMMLKEDEKDAWQAVLIQNSRIPAPQLNGNVPYGSGNKTPGSNTDKFYPETDSGVLTEQNAQIIVE